MLQARNEEEALQLRVQHMRDAERKKKDADIRRTEEIRHKVTQEKKQELNQVARSKAANPFLAQDKERKEREARQRAALLAKYNK